MKMKTINLIAIVSVMVFMVSCQSTKDQKEETSNETETGLSDDQKEEVRRFNNLAIDYYTNNAIADSSIIYFNNALEIDNENKWVMENKINLLCMVQDFENAYTCSKKYTEIEFNESKWKNKFNCFLKHSAICTQVNKTDEGKQIAAQAVELWNSNAEELKKQKAYALILSGNEKEGREILQTLLDKDPDNWILEEIVKKSTEVIISDILIEGGLMSW